jgi:hypothetical protein
VPKVEHDANGQRFVLQIQEGGRVHEPAVLRYRIVDRQTRERNLLRTEFTKKEMELVVNKVPGGQYQIFPITVSRKGLATDRYGIWT